MKKIIVSDNNEEFSYIDKKDIDIIKEIFAKPIADIVKTAKENNTEVEPILKAVIPEEFIDALKNGNLKLMESKSGEILPNIVDDKNKIIKQVRLEEIKEKLDNKKVDKLEEYILEQKLEAIKEQLEHAICLLEDIDKGQRNNRYSKVDSAIMDIKQSFLTPKSNYRETMQALAQSKLNYALESVYKSFNEEIIFFKEWEKRGFIEKNLRQFKYSTINIRRVFNNLCKDYLYIKKAKNILIDLHINQGIKKCDIEFLLDEFYKEDKKIEETNIKSWLPPKSSRNEWQYKILNIPSYNNKLIIEYNTKELLEGE